MTQSINVADVQKLAIVIEKDVINTATLVRADLLDKLGIKLWSGVEFKNTKRVLNRKGGTSRQKMLNTNSSSIKSAIGFLEDRVLETKLAWNRYDISQDEFAELGGFNTTGSFERGMYPTAELALNAIGKTFGEDMMDCLFHGDASLKDESPLGLYDGFITNIKKDIEKGRICEENRNLIPTVAIIAPVDREDTEAFDIFFEAWLKTDTKLRNRELVQAKCTSPTKAAIINAYFNKYGQLQSNDAMKPEFRFVGMDNVELVSSDMLGTGDMIIFSIPDNMEYGVDTESSDSQVRTTVNPEDQSMLIGQIQTKAGTRIVDVNPSAFAVTTGTLVHQAYAGDYKKDTLAVMSNNKNMGTVAAAPAKPEYEAGETVTLTATATGENKFVSWGDGVTTNPRVVIKKGKPEGYVAIFAAK